MFEYFARYQEIQLSQGGWVGANIHSRFGVQMGIDVGEAFGEQDRRPVRGR